MIQTRFRKRSPFPQYLVVEGPIGVGKTTLVKALAERLQGRSFLESVDDNPFLADFYAEPARYAFQNEMFFLMSRFQQQEQFRQGDLFESVHIGDYLFTKSRLFASLTLTDHELAMFDRVYDVMSQQVVDPDVVIYLRAPVELLEKRIAVRARTFEHTIDRHYLERLSALYTQFFRHYRRQPVVWVETEGVNFGEDPHLVDQLIERIEEVWMRPNPHRNPIQLDLGAPSFF